MYAKRPDQSPGVLLWKAREVLVLDDLQSFRALCGALVARLFTFLFHHSGDEIEDGETEHAFRGTQDDDADGEAQQAVRQRADVGQHQVDKAGHDAQRTQQDPQQHEATVGEQIAVQQPGEGPCDGQDGADQDLARKAC